MINAIQNVITNPAIASIAQNTNQALIVETTLKAIGRPSFILMDGDISKDTKKYAATKELLYQATCLLVYMALVVPVFKRGVFKLAKNSEFFKKFDDIKILEKFKSADEVLDYHKLTERSLPERQKAIKKDKYKNLHHDLLKNLENANEPEKYPLVKGVVELGNITGSVLGLAILAPQVSHAIIHPALRFLGLEKKREPEIKSENKLDTQV